MTDICLPTPAFGSFDASSARRLVSLSGKRIGLLDNRKAHAAELLSAIGANLESAYGISIVWRAKDAIGVPVEGSSLDDLTACDGVITALGD
jgi:hypothetical protein